jgi:hypothetical protein
MRLMLWARTLKHGIEALRKWFLRKGRESKGAGASPDADEQTRWSDEHGRVDQSMTSMAVETEMSHKFPRATLRRR